jgi:hypothetical protein
MTIFAVTLFRRSWDSPTLTTWGSFALRTGSLLVLLPLVLTRFSNEEIALYYLFSTLIGLQLLLDLGFGAAFSRAFAYAMGGASPSALQNFRQAPNATATLGPNWGTLEKIWTTTFRVYWKLAIVSLLVMGLLGSLSLIKPISLLPSPASAWAAWVIVLAGSTVTLVATPYTAFLQGTNHVAIFRRWEGLTLLGSLLSSITVLVMGGGLLGLVLANQLWAVISACRNRWLARNILEGRARAFAGSPSDDMVYAAVWPAAWRSGLGVLMSHGLIHASGVIYAQLGTAETVAAYLIALRLIQTISTFSQAPFYSKLPMLARLRAEGRTDLQVAMARRGMFLSYSTFVLAFVVLGVGGPFIFHWIESNADFPSPALWSLMGIAFFVERYGAMHLQFYSTTNHIVWHIANGVSGVIYLGTALLLFPHFGVYAFPVAIILAYLSFYSWYAARYSYKAFKLQFPQFEGSTSFAPVICLLIYSLYACFK